MTNRLPLRLAPALLAVALAAAACTSDSDAADSAASSTPSTNLDSSQILLTAGLQTVDSCDALLNRIKDDAIERVGPYGFDQGGGPIAFDGGGFDREEAAEDGAVATDQAVEQETAAVAPQAEASGDDAAAESVAATGEGDVSGTNIQEQGVDEADLVKTDGDRLVVVSGNVLRVIDATRATPELVNSIELPEETGGGELFLAGDRALLMTTGYTERPFIASDTATTDWYVGSPIGRLMEIDLNDGRVVRTLEFEGSYLSAREIDGSIRIVLSAPANRFAFVYPSNDGAVDAAEQANRALIESSTIEQWLPTYRITEGGATVTEGPIVDCDRVHLPSEFAGFGSLVMLTADLDSGLAINDALSVFTDAQTMYASTDRVAVATPKWPTYGPQGEIVEDGGNDYSTAIHTFDITDPDRASYVASGAVRGHLLNQYSLSEHGGYLRVATTDGSPWWGGSETSESFVTVLAEDANVLSQVGQVGGLGLDEQIFAVRFIGDRGYVVTFRQIDPLYTIDLSDPANPRVAGELKIPGFSSYLHPVDGDHLLGVGTDGDEEGRTSGTVVSLFDVSDPSNPSLTTKLNLDEAAGLGLDGSSYTPVSNDAKAFTYWDGTAIVPISWWQYDPEVGSETNGSSAVLVDVDVDGTQTELGRVSHPSTRECEGGIIVEEPIPVEPTDDTGTSSSGSTDAEAGFVEPEPDSEPQPEPEPQPDPEPDNPVTDRIAPEEYCYTWTPEIQRSVIIGGDLYTVSDAGVRVNDFATLADVTWIKF
jgi:hypothetical protein